MNNIHIKIAVFFIGLILCVQTSSGQTLTNIPCGNPPPAANQWTDGDCSAVSTAGFTNSLNITTCGPLSTTTIDGWGWYMGTGGGANTITFTPSGGGDAVIQVFEAQGDPCSVSFLIGDCADNAGAGGAETITGGGEAGTFYIFIVENAAGTGTVSGTLCLTENPATCNDGIQNGTETGIDCGGSCPFLCPPPATTSTNACPTVVNSPMEPITCSLIGTPGFAAATGTVTFNGSLWKHQWRN